MGFDTILGLQPRDKAAMLVVNAKWCLVPRGENAFVLSHQHGRCDVTCKNSNTLSLTWQQRFLFLPQCCSIEISGQVLAFLPLVLLRTFHELKIHFSTILVYNVILAALIGALLTSFCTLMYTVVFNHLRNNCDLAQDFIHKHHTI